MNRRFTPTLAAALLMVSSALAYGQGQPAASNGAAARSIR
jgi:hypothetical protein